MADKGRTVGIEFPDAPKKADEKAEEPAKKRAAKPKPTKE